MKTSLNLLVLLLFAVNSLLGQSTGKLLNRANYTMYKEDFKSAIIQFDAILEKHPKNKDAIYHKLIAEHLTIKKGTDISDLIAFEDSKGHSDKFYNYWLGRVHFVRYEFDLAQEHFEAFLSVDAYKSKEIVAEAKHFLSWIEKASKAYELPNNFELEALDYPINSIHDDLSPGFFKQQSELVFASSRPYTGIEKSAKEFLVFHAERGTSGWNSPRALRQIGKLPANASKVEVSNEGSKLFIFSFEKGGDLYFSQARNSSWSRPVELDVNMRGNRVESDFFINAEETHILFATKRGGGKLDIYESRKSSDGSWSVPSALEGWVNTEWDEDSPYLSADGKTLYFSSNQPKSMGGFDVFKSTLNVSTGKWSAPENMGFPLNTIDDEINFELNPDNISGFLSSNRLHSLGGYDIYYFHKQGRVLASGMVQDLDGKPAKGVEVLFHPVKYHDQSFKALTDASGNYEVEIFSNEDFDIELVKSNEVFHKDNFHTEVEKRNKRITKNFQVEVPDIAATDFSELFTGEVTEEETEELELLGSKFRSGQKAVIRNIYFEPNSARVSSESYLVIDQIKDLLVANPNLTIEIGGHTDQWESENEFDEVSLHRARNVRNLLMERDIASSRVSARGYGASQPLASNDDETDGRELNRRIEVRVVE